jgi:hypothetical protein
MSMFGFSSNRFSGQKMSSGKSTFRPQLEALETRAVLSTSSASLHAVTDVFGDNVAIFLQSTAGKAPQLTTSSNILGNEGAENSTIPTGVPNTPNGVQSFSVGLDSNGHTDLFVKALDGSFWFIGGHGWSQIQLPGNSQVESFAAVDGGRVYALFQDNSLNVLTAQGVAAHAPSLVTIPPYTPPPRTWAHVYGAGSVTALDAVTDKNGHDAVFVENADKSFGEFYSPTNAWLSVPAGQAYIGPYTQLASAGQISHFYVGGPTTTTFSQVVAFSAGTDANGYADVFATWYTGNLEKYVRGTGWTMVAAPNTFGSYTATDSGVAWIIGADGHLGRYDGSTIATDVFGSGGAERSVAAASSLTAFVTFPNGDIVALLLDPNPNNYGQTWAVGTTPY